MPPFPGVDFLDFDSLLSDEEKLARNTARQFVDAEIMPIIEEYNREGKFPVQLVPQMAELGLFGASLKGYGCAGMSNVEYGLVTQELERGDSGLRSFVSVQSALVMYPIHAPAATGKSDRMLRADGAAIRIESGRNVDARGEKRRRLHSERRKNVDHQRLNRGCGGDMGEVRGRGDPRIPGGKRYARIQGLGRARKIFAARFGNFRSGDDGL